MQYMKEHGGFSLSEFHSWGNWSHDPEFNKGEYSIFTLPDFSSYDGIIADLTCIQDTIVRSRIAQMIVNSGVPAITLCNQEKGMTCVRSDNYNAVRQLFNHLWTVHGCRSFFFAGSSGEMSESAERKAAFIDSCSRHNIPLTKDMFLENDFSVTTGIQTARLFFRSGSTGSTDAGTNAGKDEPIRPIPDAFICANDNIAIGILIEMKKHGWLCPRDFKVTGFDNLDKAMYYQPQVTTVTLDRERIAYHAMEILDRMINGQKVPENVHTPARIIYAESCGCQTSSEINYRAYLAWQVEDSIYVDDRNERFSAMVSSLDPSLSLPELMQRIADSYASMDLDGAYIVLDDRIGSGELEEGCFTMEHLNLIEARENVPEAQKEPGRLRSDCADKERILEVQNEPGMRPI